MKIKLFFLITLSSFISLPAMDDSTDWEKKKEEEELHKILEDALDDFETDEFEKNIKTKNMQQLLDEYSVEELLNFYHSSHLNKRQRYHFYFKQMMDRIKAGDNINTKDQYGEASLFRAIRLYNGKMLRFLLDRGADITINDNSTALLIAVVIANYDAVKVLIKAGIDVNKPSGNISPLKAAAFKRMPAMVNILLTAGADVNQENENGETALFFALRSIFLTNYSVEIIKDLLQNGADPLIKNNNGQTALDIARQRNNQEIVDLLLEHKKKKIL